ncbi:hypothetical protein DID88_004507 [Monilinia fructigena]|uniref:BTB domain-containing protein n=1 Tax=Monilinia fructigena TaxID=38457 RepID=A0A395IS34_9HELO|nr:hypothetical protein DID88_004507 [Monilinia fructigena]
MISNKTIPAAKSTQIINMSHLEKMTPYMKALAEKDKKEGSNVVHMRIGKSLQGFAIEKEVLYRHSSYLKELLQSGSEEHGPATIDLPKTEVKTFKLFRGWLYKQGLGSAEEKIAEWKSAFVKNGKGADETDETPLIDLDEGNNYMETKIADFDSKSNVGACQVLCQPLMADLLILYLFADMARLPALKNDCITKFYGFTKATEYIMTGWLQYIWEYTDKKSMMHKFLLDLLTWEMSPSVLETNSKDFPEDLRLELLISMGYVIQIARHGSSASELENSNPLKDLSKYYEKVEEVVKEDD